MLVLNLSWNQTIPTSLLFVSNLFVSGYVLLIKIDFVSYIYDICSVWFLRVVLFHSVFTFFSFINHRRLYCVQFLILFHLTQIRSLIFVLQLFSHLWGILIIFSSQFSLIFLQTQRRLCTLLSYSYADWDSLRNHLRDVP